MLGLMKKKIIKRKNINKEKEKKMPEYLYRAVDDNFETNIKGLYCIGDGGGMTRGLMMASCSGIELARILTR